MAPYGISPAHLVTGLLIFVRVLGIFTSAPVFGHMHLPAQVKVSLAVMISLVLLPIVPLVNPGVTDNLLLLGASAVKEAAVGVIIGFVATVAFVAIQLAGEAADIQVGFGLASIADPLLGTRTSLMGQFQYMTATLLFLALNGHHFLVTALARSFQLVPVGDFTFHALLTGRILTVLSEVFLIGLRIGAPVILAVLLTDLALGLLGRTVPQMNLLQVGFPVKIAVGLGVLLVSLPFFLVCCQGLFETMYRDILLILRAM